MNSYIALWYQSSVYCDKRELEEEFLGFSFNKLPIWNEITKIQIKEDLIYLFKG